MKIKRFLASVLSVVMLLGLVMVPGLAADTAKFTLDAVNNGDGTITVTVKAGSAMQLAGIGLTLTASPADCVKATNAKPASLPDGGSGAATPDTTVTSMVGYSGAAVGNMNIPEGTELFQVQYSVEDKDASSVTFNLAVNAEDIFDEDYNEVSATGDSKVVELGASEPTQYTVKFVADGKTLSETKYDEGTAAKDVKVPADPTKDGYKFTGWDKTVADVTADATYTAQFEKVTTQYTVKFVADGKTLSETKYDAGTAAKDVKVPADPTKDGYKFTGWDKAVADVTADATYTAQFEKNPETKQYTVKFVADGKTLSETKYDEGTAAKDVKVPTEPTKDGYKFTGWDKAVADVTADATYTAQFEKNPETKQYTVTFDTNGKGTAPEAAAVAENAKVAKPDDPTATGFKFDGWYTDKECTTAYDFETPVTADITLYAKWTEVATYTVTFDANGHGTAPDALTVNEGDKAEAPTAPSASGFSFGGWYTDKECKTEYDFDTAVTADITLYAMWTKASSSSSGGGFTRITVSKDATENGTLTISSTTPVEGSKVTVTAKPADGYKLDALTVTNVKTNAAVKVTDNGDGTFTFTAPSNSVKVGATFVKGEGTTPTDPTTPTTPEKTSFVDVPKDAWFAPAVDWAVEKGVTNGTSATTFSPNADLTRGQAVTFLWRLMGQPASAGANPFEDVSANDYYYDAVVWAVDLGVTKGTSDVTFSPSDTVTRGQLVTFIYRLLKEPAVGQDNPFSDVDSSAYYGNAVIWAAENGIVQGYPDGTFKPGNDITRAEMVTVLNKGASLAGIA